MTDSTINVDVAIVGGGMVGAALACGLGQAGFHVALVEYREPLEDWDSSSYDLRVSAITRASQRVFEHLHAWQGMVNRRVTPYREMQVWDAGGFAQIHFDAADIGEPDLGYIIENRIIQCALWDRLQQLDSIQLFCPAEVAELVLAEDRPVLRLSDGTRMSAGLVVAADGANSRLREMAGIGTRGWPYDQTAVVATVRAEQGHQGTAWQRFMPGGPLALLPTNRDLFSIVWSVPPDQADQLLEMSDQAFSDALTEASESRLGRLTLLAERAAFPLRLQHAETYLAPGLVLVGDAAHVIHPLAGQGVNLGLLDAACLVDVLTEARTHGRQPGARGTLRRYERARMAENIAMQAAMDGFKRLFSNEIPPLKLARNLGLGLADKLVPVKQMLIRRALGNTGELPTLARRLE